MLMSILVYIITRVQEALFWIESFFRGVGVLFACLFVCFVLFSLAKSGKFLRLIRLLSQLLIYLDCFITFHTVFVTVTDKLHLKLNKTKITKKRRNTAFKYYQNT